MRNSIRRRRRVIIALAAMLPLPANALQSRLGVTFVDIVTLAPKNIPQNSNNFASPTSLCASSHDTSNDGECNYESNTFPFATRRSVISQAARAMFLGTVVISCASLSTIASAEGSDELYLRNLLGRREQMAHRHVRRLHWNICCRRHELGCTYIKPWPQLKTSRDCKSRRIIRRKRFEMRSQNSTLLCFHRQGS